MAEEYPAAVYSSGSWWMPPRSAYNHSSCSSDLAYMENLGPFWPKDLMQMKSNSSDHEPSDSSMVFHDNQTISTTEWNQNLLLVQEEMTTFSTTCDGGLKVDIEAEHHAFTVDQLQSLFDSNSQPRSQPPQQEDPLYDISSVFPSLQSQLIPIKPDQEIRDLGSSKKSSSELTFKRPRLETPSPLPTFKVRKEKLGDRITALQQLVSPFGKTDTASVLHEAIEYIKLLHDQVNILSTPYSKGATKQLQPVHDKVRDEEHIQDLRSRGLCLVPLSSMFPVATEMATSFWAPSYKGS